VLLYTQILRTLARVILFFSQNKWLNKYKICFSSQNTNN
jgi:hypothetical protein